MASFTAAANAEQAALFLARVGKTCYNRGEVEDSESAFCDIASNSIDED